MICDRCGIANRAGRITCVQCLGPLLNGTGPGPVAMCAEHPDHPATGKCITCKKLVCDACGGVVNNRGVYCIDHTPVVTTSGRASPGMNPLLAGAGGDMGGGAVAAKKPAANTGVVMGIVGIIALVLVVVALLVWPGILKSPDVPQTATAGTGFGGPGVPGADPYGVGGPGGAYGPGSPGFSPGGGPYGPGGPAGPGGPVPGSPYGSGGPPGGVPGGAIGPSAGGA